jgi:hypothetical protein
VASRNRFELYSLLLDAAALEEVGAQPFGSGGDPARDLLQSAKEAGLEMRPFPFTAVGYVVHLGRGTLAAVAEAGETGNPLYAWATEHHEPHLGGIDRAHRWHQEILARFRADVGPGLDLVAALRR